MQFENLWPAQLSFEGRIGRKQYWIRTLVCVVGGSLGIALLVTLCILNYNPPNDAITARTMVGFVVLAIAILAFGLVLIGAVLSAGVRRLHDRGKSGGWLFLYYVVPHQVLFDSYLWQGDRVIIPLAAITVLIWGLIDLGMLRGEAADNAYGPHVSSQS
jgi:uncharacterized membrane protein YhaH (DUF805 family)